MGCCGSKEDASDLESRERINRPSASRAETNNLSRDKQQRQFNWARTGIVGLRDARLKELPKEAIELGVTVRNLDATNNAITVLPPAISGFAKIQRLVLVNNQLSSLPPEIGRLLMLKLLAVDGNRLAALPEEIGQLSKLEKLTASRNSLRALPPSVSSLSALTHLDVSHNVLSGLPPTLGQCAALETLNAEHNGIHELPLELGSLKRLKELNLDSNNVGTVPSEIFVQCSSLQTLSLHSNPVTEEILIAVDGYSNFRERLRAKHDKRIDGGVLLGAKGLDDGLDHDTNRTRIVVPHT
uniref:Disease resistance R13L4/SHOC-2-like LRR domain-containing protein n=1 Tax=Pyramimonas obovata TaxID=1411642 RepID=A0A7S0N1X5_9CHLO|mmetsp:Transcript_17972/g.39237  ORF Transcript_17972/g.39237 Transcript_17972/m.39237 type:complete len:298 (+) Transcript_17972:153-1046(+)